MKGTDKKEAAPNLEGLVAVVELQERLVMPGRTKPIARAALDRLINKIQRAAGQTSGRVKFGKGPGAMAYLTKDMADRVENYFKIKHTK